jgi:hypothetical protein
MIKKRQFNFPIRRRLYPALPYESKEPDAFASGSFSSLAQDSDVGRLRAFRALLDDELDLLAFLQVTEPVALDGGEMDENVRSTLTGDKAEALVAIEPLDGTIDTFRHCLPPLAKLQLGVLFVPSGQNKTTHGMNRELPLFLVPT